MEQWANSRFREIAEEYVHSERDRLLIIRKYCDDRTFEQVAEEFDISVSQAKRIAYKQGQIVFRIMERN